MTFAPISPIASAAAGPVVSLSHACARHPAMHGERACVSCATALCTACARSLAHRECPACRTRRGESAHVLDASWRVALLLDAYDHALRAIPRRKGAIAAIVLCALALAVPFGVVEASPHDDGWERGFTVAVAFTSVASMLGVWLQPLLAFPTVRPASVARHVLGGVLAMALVAAPNSTLAGVGAGLSADEDPLATLLGLAFVAVNAVCVPAALAWQGSIVLGAPLRTRGMAGAVLAHAVLALANWMGFLGLLFPAGAAILCGFLVNEVVAGIIGVVLGTLLWLATLVSMGAFAAGSARFADDRATLS